MKNLFFVLSLLMFIFSCGKEIASAVASNPSNTTTAPWRFTRGTISSDVTNSEKDLLCVSEFGSDYVAGTSHEFYSVVVNVVGYTVVANRTNVINANSVMTDSVFCFHK